MGYSVTQRDFIGQLQCQNKHLRAEVDAFKSGQKYLDMVARNKAETDSLRRYYERKLAEKDREIAEAHKETARVRRIFMEANEDVLKEKADTIAKMEKKLEQKQKTIDDKDGKIAQLEEIIKQLNSVNVDLRKKLNDKEEEVKKLRSRLKKNSKNSSIPTSRNGFRGKVTNGRVSSGKKPGGQIGHKGNPRPELVATSVVEVPAPEWILADPKWVPMTGDKACRTKKIAECCLSVNVTEFRSFGFKNLETQETYYPPLPGKTDNELEYGDSIKAMAFLMNNVLHVPLRKTNQFFQWASEGAMKNAPSIAWINGLTKEFAAKTETEREEMFNRLMTGEVLYTDQTTVRINGILKNITVSTDKENVMYFVKDHKGFEGYNDTPAELFEGILVHDGDKTLLHYGSEHQLCNSHEIRYCQGAKEDEPNKTWAGKMQSLLREGIYLRNQREDHKVPEETVQDIERRFDEIIKIADREFEAEPPTANREPYNTYQRIKNGKAYLLFYLRHPEVDPTNNVAERCGRAFKGKLNVSGTFRSGKDGRSEEANASAQYFCDTLGVVETAKNQGKNLYEYAKEVFGRDSFPKAAAEEVPA